MHNAPMRLAGRGRIVFWEGASLWLMEALPHQGLARTTDHHSHHAIQITLALGGRFDLRTRKESAQVAAAVAPDETHVFEALGLGAHIFIEPESEAGRAICASLFRKSRLARLPDALIGDIPERLQAAWRGDQTDKKLLEALGRELVARLAGLSAPKAPDPRVAKMIAFAAAHLD